jgi:hypothetical protein
LSLAQMAALMEPIRTVAEGFVRARISHQTPTAAVDREAPGRARW